MRVGALQGLSSSGLSPNEGVEGSRVTGGLFCHFYFSFSTMLPKKLSKHVLTCIDISGTKRT